MPILDLFDYVIVAGILGIVITALFFLCKEFIKHLNKQVEIFLNKIDQKDKVIEKKNEELIKITREFKDAILEINKKQDSQNNLFNDELKEINNKIDVIKEKIDENINK